MTLHDLAFLHDPGVHRARAFTAGLDRMRRDAAAILCSSQATLDDAAITGLAPERLRLVPSASNPSIVPTPTTCGPPWPALA